MPQKTLIIDRDVLLAQSLAEHFEERGCSVTLVNDADRARELIAGVFFNIILVNSAALSSPTGDFSSFIAAVSPLSVTVFVNADAPDAHTDLRAAINDALAADKPLTLRPPIDVPLLMERIEARIASRKQAAQKNILFVEDNEAVLQTLSPILETEGYAVTGATTGAQAVAALRSKYFGIVISDYKLPDITGLDVIKKVRQVDPSLPIIFVTAYADIDVVLTALKEHVIDFLTKPIEPEHLFASLKKIAVLQKARDARERH